MNLIRSVIHILWMIITVIPWATVVLIISSFISKERLYRVCVAWLGIAVRSSEVILGIRNRITGLENLPTGQNDAVVLLCKHQSAWETLCIPMLMPHPIAYVFKHEILYIPFFGWCIGLLEMIHIDRNRRSAAFAKILQKGKCLASKGIWVTMFPEGTRVERGAKGTYRSGGTRLAIHCGVPVVPIAVTSAKCWPRKAFIKRPGTVDISIGPPIPSAGRQPDDLIREVEAWIENEMLRLDPEAYPDGKVKEISSEHSK